MGVVPDASVFGSWTLLANMLHSDIAVPLCLCIGCSIPDCQKLFSQVQVISHISADRQGPQGFDFRYSAWCTQTIGPLAGGNSVFRDCPRTCSLFTSSCSTGCWHGWPGCDCRFVKGKMNVTISVKYGILQSTQLCSCTKERYRSGSMLFGIRQAPKQLGAIVKIVVPLWVISMIRHLVFRGSKREHSFDNYPDAVW